MEEIQGESLVLSSDSSLPRSVNNIKRRYLCFCGEEVVVMASSTGIEHGRRYIGCGRMPKCTFEWIDEDEGLKGQCVSSIQRRVRCFCGDSLTLRTSGTSRNSNRRFISCPNIRCKFFEWVDKDAKLGSIKIQGTNRQSSSTLDAVNLGIRGTMEEHAILQAQERKMNSLRVDMGRFNVEIRKLDDCVGRLCEEFNVVQEQVGRLEDNMKKQKKNCS
ncbi:hypothetical protein PIB30_017395 [Stylosanthes scabra]|uniref:GRF-type domain-containing protein n=1 Tax=Stylosanthes scabra TaxID=79078 RepID=A0ABU6V8G6_9FABA|nr:hypothetical protein [Stylosanthes scabra]